MHLVRRVLKRVPSLCPLGLCPLALLPSWAGENSRGLIWGWLEPFLTDMGLAGKGLKPDLVLGALLLSFWLERSDQPPQHVTFRESLEWTSAPSGLYSQPPQPKGLAWNWSWDVGLRIRCQLPTPASTIAPAAGDERLQPVAQRHHALKSRRRVPYTPVGSSGFICSPKS